MKSPLQNSEKSIKKKSAVGKIFKVIGFLFLVAILGLGIAEYVYRNEKETPLYKIQQYVTYSKEDWTNYENNKRILASTPVESNITEVATAAPESPIDTLMWENAIKNKDYIPDEVLAEIKRYKARDFSKLILAENKPTSEEAQNAIIAHYKNEVTKLLDEYKAHIQIGTAYNAPLQSQDELVRVTAMVSAFNKERGNLGNIQMPLDVIYDFVQYKSEPNVWYVSDFSQNIPYDYKLNKDPW
ncbi:hypothetical protein NAL32_20460 [Chryseobacterium sp. Ch-15]|uniref:Uncharacterized protein n=1 Tax=Chryseobacterium muglaense TaxID=2893752 RepID=A0A9Q3UUN1_9FLAO|nr:hypothetical protein [Chryseobacterium muglaense]MBD3906598.1 hypothetical protein [Chryseobacterium muglaense]MCC9034323.1 hypothetical protein [Chryseobacterium muglaense]MCM2556769.1 hypothetical protein [Chryseobacterium muglaense]